MLNIKQALGHFGLNVNIQLICTRVSSYAHSLFFHSLPVLLFPELFPQPHNDPSGQPLHSLHNSVFVLLHLLRNISLDGQVKKTEIVLLKHGHIHKFLAHKHVIVTYISHSTVFQAKNLIIINVELLC